MQSEEVQTEVQISVSGMTPEVTKIKCKQKCKRKCNPEEVVSKERQCRIDLMFKSLDKVKDETGTPGPTKIEGSNCSTLDEVNYLNNDCQPKPKVIAQSLYKEVKEMELPQDFQQLTAENTNTKSTEEGPNNLTKVQKCKGQSAKDPKSFLTP